MQSLKIPLGEIITFYSYKGGAGRSMALANVACLLAEKWSEGKGVLMIDWDLEAPGLHKFFHDKFTGLSLREFKEKPGLIDLFLKLNEVSAKSSFASQEEAKKIASDALDSIKLEEFIIKTDIPRLSLIKAGHIDQDYSHHVRSFDWENLYNLSPLLIRLFAERLSEQYRYVLIDSRTGYTDIGGICTMLMPQKLVVVFTPSRQSYDGTEELVKKATTYRRQSRDLRPLIVYPLPSRIEGSMEKLRTEWRFGNPDKDIPGYQPMFEKLFKEAYGLSECKLDEYFKNIQIQQSPDYAYGEDIAVNKIGQTKDRLSLTESYEKFTQMLVSSDPPWQSTIEKINVLCITAQRSYDNYNYNQALDAWKEVLEIDNQNQTALEGIKAIKKITPEKAIVGKKERLDRKRLIISALTVIVGIIVLYGFYIMQSPQLSVSQDSFDFGTMSEGTSNYWTFDISNAGLRTLEWNVSTDQPWITINPKNGAGSGRVYIRINTTGLQPGNHSGIITVLSNGGTEIITISLNVILSPQFSEFKMVPGRILFNLPQEMIVGEKEKVEVRLTKVSMENLSNEDLSKGLKGRGEPQIENISISTFMGIRLIGDNFIISTLSIEEQIVVDDEFTTWGFYVVPSKSGNQTLTLLVSIRIETPTGEWKQDSLVLENQINVKP